MYDYETTKDKFNSTLSKISKLETAGKIRRSKGQLCVNLCCDIILEAAKQLELDLSNLKIEKDKIVETEIENTEVDVVVSYNDKEIIYAECKSYTEISMFKRFSMESLGLQSKNKDAKICIFQLENALGGDYSEDQPLESQQGASNVNKLLDMIGVDIDIVTMLNGRRCASKPIHQEEFRKSFNKYKYNRAIEYFKNILFDYSI